MINGYAQTNPVHYFIKDFATPWFIERYEQRIF